MAINTSKIRPIIPGAQPSTTLPAGQNVGAAANTVVTDIGNPTAGNGMPAGYDALAQALSTSLWGDIGKGQDWASPYFGRGDGDMSRLIDERERRAYGTDQQRMDLERSQGMAGINQQLATNLRQLKGLQGATGLRGGAAIGQALPALSGANQARAGLETNLRIAENQRKDQALKDLESTLTGERAGMLGTTFGIAGLGAQSRGNALQYLLGNNFLNASLMGLNQGATSQTQRDQQAAETARILKGLQDADKNIQKGAKV